jgi:uncharacterized repeat protein (TIGR03803 family)
MEIKQTSMRPQLTTLHNGSGAREMTEPFLGKKPLLAQLIRQVLAATLLLPVFCARGGVVLTTLYSFNSGVNLRAGLVQGSDGYFYGTTENGGANNAGSVFRMSTNGALTTLYSFSGGKDGGNPYSGLVQGSDGYLYGTTEYGGGYNQNGYSLGTVFKISTTGVLTSLYSFTGGNDGGNPNGLVQGSDDNFYGTTAGSTVFKISTNGTLTSLYSLHSFTGHFGPNGLAQGSDGNLYVTAGIGGTNGGYGIMFKISTNGALTSLYSFNGTNGAFPNGLVQGSDGNLYGTTVQGGTNGGYGTVFQINPNGALASLYSFSYNDVGFNPSAVLVQGSDGNLYGTTVNSSVLHYAGTVFRISTNGALSTLYSFTNGVDGGEPNGLVQGRDGSFYGTTQFGGAGGYGTFFRLTMVSAATVFQSVALTNGTLSLTWSTEAGGTYQLQYNSDLSSSNWASLGSALTATGATLSVTDSVTNGPQRFYRLVLLP